MGGATAQEEDLCRQCPTLYSTLHKAHKDGMYPFGPCTWKSKRDPGKYSDVLYTQGLTVARDGMETGYNLLPREKEVTVSLISAAAPNVRFAKEHADPQLLYKTIQSIFTAPRMIEPEVDTLILGAFGCGAFGNDPKEVAQLFVQGLIKDNYGMLYKEIH